MDGESQIDLTVEHTEISTQSTVDIYKEYEQNIIKAFPNKNFELFFDHLEKYCSFNFNPTELLLFLYEKIKNPYEETLCEREVILRSLQSIYFILQNSYISHESMVDFGCQHCLESETLLSFLIDFKPHHDCYDTLMQEIIVCVVCKLFEKGLCPKVQDAAIARLIESLKHLQNPLTVYYSVIMAISSINQSLLTKEVDGQSLIDTIYSYYRTLLKYLHDQLSRNLPSGQNALRALDVLLLAHEQHVFQLNHCNIRQDLPLLQHGFIRSHCFHNIRLFDFSLTDRRSKVQHPMYSLSRFLLNVPDKSGRSQIFPQDQKCSLSYDEQSIYGEDEDQITVGHFKLI